MPAAEVAANQISRLQRATVEIVAKHGYHGAKVRDIAHLAGVSTKAFYEHFDSKQDCVLQTYDVVARRTTRRIIASQIGERDWSSRARAVLIAFTEGLKAAPSPGRFALIEARAAGPAATVQIRSSESDFEAILAECLAREPYGIVLPPLVVEGIVAGVTRVASAGLASGRTIEMSRLTHDLVEWASCYAGEQVSDLEELDMRSVPSTAVEPSKTASNENGAGTSTTPDSDRALILSAVAKLTVSDGYSELTVPRIRRAAGISRRTFDAHFGDVDDCFVAALDQQGRIAISKVALAQVASRTWSGGLYRALAVLCDRLMADRFLASVCLGGSFDSAPRINQARQRLTVAVAEQFRDSIPPRYLPSKLALEGTEGAVWGLIRNHILRDAAQCPQMNATVAYMALAPLIGSSAAIAAIRQEQES